MSADELIYKVKLEADANSFKEVSKALDEIEKKAKSAGKGGKGNDVEEGAKKQSSALKNLRKELASYKEQLAEVNSIASKFGGVSGVIRRQQIELGASIRDTNARIQESTRGFADQESALINTPTTYNQIVEQNRALSIAMRDIPIGEQTEELKRLQAQYLENNNKLKEFDASMGNFQRNVGDYTGGLRTFANGLAVVQGPLGPIAGRVNSLATVIEKLTTAKKVSAVASTRLGRVMQGNITLFTLSAAATKKKAIATTAANFAIKGLNIGIKALRLSLIALGIPALVIAVSSLTQAFTRSEEGQIKLRIILAQISGVVNTLRERAINLGLQLTKLWDSPGLAVEVFKTRIKNLGRAIVANIVDRVTAIPDLFSGIFDQVIGTFQFLGAKVKLILADVPILGAGIDADKAAQDVDEASQKVLEGFIKTREALGKIANVDFIVDPIMKVVEGYKALRDEAIANGKVSRDFEERLQRELIIQRNLSVERAKQAKNFQQAREFVRDTNNSLDDRIAKIREVNKAEKELLDQELTNERNILEIMQGQFDQFKSSKEEAQALAEQKIKVAQIEAQSSEKSMSALRDENALVRKQTELIESEAKMQFDLRTGLREKELNAEVFNLESIGKMREAHLLRMEQIGVDAEERKNRLIDELNAKGFQQQFTDTQIAEMAKQQIELEIAQETQEAKQKLDELEFQNKLNMAKQLSQSLGAVNSAFFKDSKELAVASSIMDTYAAVNAALKAPPGFPYNIPSIVAAGATGFANVKKILSTKLGDKTVKETAPKQPNISTSFGLVDVGTNSPMASQMASQVGAQSNQFQPTFVFTGDLDPEIMAIKVREGSNAISGKSISIGA